MTRAQWELGGQATPRAWLAQGLAATRLLLKPQEGHGALC